MVDISKRVTIEYMVRLSREEILTMATSSVCVDHVIPKHADVQMAGAGSDLLFRWTETHDGNSKDVPSWALQLQIAWLRWGLEQALHLSAPMNTESGDKEIKAIAFEALKSAGFDRAVPIKKPTQYPIIRTLVAPN